MVVGVVVPRVGRVSSKGTKVSGSVVNTFATCTIEEMFENEGSQAAECCSLMIDAGRDFVIYDVKIIKAGETIEFSVEDLEEAQENFEAAQNGGYFSALGTKDASADALHLEIGNIEPHASFSVAFNCSFSASLVSKRSLSLNFPFNSSFADSKFSVEMRIFEDQKISKLSFNNNNCTVKKIDDGSHLLQGSVNRLKSSPSIKIDFENDVESSAVSCNINGEKFIGASIVPLISEEVTAKSEVIIIIDCSGSMSGRKMEIAKETLKIFIKSLPFDSFFNVIRFGSNFESIFDESVPYNREHSESALEHAGCMLADLGGTDLLSPLSYVFGLNAKEGFVRQIFIITDGQVDNEGTILSLASKHRNNHRLFSVGIGSDVASGFIRELAECSLGTSTIIKESSSDIMRATMEQLKSSLAPAISQVQAHISATDSFEVAPFPLPPIFSERINTIFFKISDKSLDDVSDFDILLSGKIGSEDHEIAVRSHGFDQSRFMIDFDKFFAFHNIHDMEEAISTRPEDTSTLKASIIRLSMQTNIVSQYTGLFTMINGVRVNNQAQAQQQQEISNQQIPMQQGFTNRQQWAQNQSNNYNHVNQRQQWNAQRYQSVEGIQMQSCSIISNNIKFENLEQSLSHSLSRGESLPQSFNREEKKSKGGFFSSLFNMFSRSKDAPPPQHESSRNNIKKFSLEQLIQDQDFEGFWDGLDEMQVFIGNKLPDKVRAELNGCDEKIICTILVLAFLTKKHENDECVWRLVYDKALTWLRSTSNMQNVKDIISRCADIL